MTFNETMQWQAVNAPHIKRLSKFGDQLATRLITAYRVLYLDKLNPFKQQEWMLICDDYCRRDLMSTTRTILQDRFGHKAPKDLRRLDS